MGLLSCSTSILKGTSAPAPTPRGRVTSDCLSDPKAVSPPPSLPPGSSDTSFIYSTKVRVCHQDGSELGTEVNKAAPSCVQEFSCHHKPLAVKSPFPNQRELVTW
jgi:hypothetical protein